MRFRQRHSGRPLKQTGRALRVRWPLSISSTATGSVVTIDHEEALISLRIGLVVPLGLRRRHPLWRFDFELGQVQVALAPQAQSGTGTASASTPGRKRKATYRSLALPAYLRTQSQFHAVPHDEASCLRIAVENDRLDPVAHGVARADQVRCTRSHCDPGVLGCPAAAQRVVRLARCADSAWCAPAAAFRRWTDDLLLPAKDLLPRAGGDEQCCQKRQ